MAKKKTTPAKPKAVKPETEKKEESVSTVTEDSKGVESTISPDVTQDTGKEKESLKSAENESQGMTFAEAEAEMDKGVPVTLPKWEGFWFKKIAGDGNVFALTAAGDITEEAMVEELKERNDWQVAAPTDEQSAILEAFWEQKKASEEVAKRNALKAVYFNRGGGSFVKTPGKFTVADLMERKYPNGTMIDSEFLLENGQVYSVKEGRITNKDLSAELQILKKQK